MLDITKIKFLLLEFITLVVNILCFRGLIQVHLNDSIASIFSLVISLGVNYIFCIKFVFGDDKLARYSVVKFIFFGVTGYVLKQLLIKIMYYHFGFSLILSKVIGFVVIIGYDYLTKRSVFDDEYQFNFRKIKNLFEKINDGWEKFIQLKCVSFFFRFLPHNIFLFLFLLGSIYYTILFIRDNDSLLLYRQAVSDSNIGPIINETVDISFEDIHVEQNVDQVCLVFGTFGRVNDSDLKFELFNGENHLTFEKEINTRSLVDGGGYCLTVPYIEKESLGEYHLLLSSSHANKQNSVTLFMDKNTKRYTMYLKRGQQYFSWKHLVMLGYLILFFGFNYYLNKKGDRLSESKFLVCMLVYILSILIINPPLENPDEPSHLYSAYNLSQNGFKADEVTEITVPEDIECLNYASIQALDRVVDYDKVKSCLANTDNMETNLMFGVRNKVTGSALGHTPQAISIKIADTFTNSSLFIFYFARLGNCLVAFLLLYWAIKIAPVGKKILLFIGLIPMFIQQETSLSYDALINSVAILFLAYMIKHLYSSEKIQAKDIVIPVLFCVVCLTVKVVYLPLIILLFFISKDKFKNKRQRIVYWGSILGLSFILYYVITKVLFVADGVLANDAASKQIHYILNNPLQLMSIAINTLKKNGWLYLQGLFAYFGWFRFSLSNFTIIACIVYFLVLIFQENSLFSKKTRYQKWLLLLAVLISIAGIFASMYFCWSTYQLDYVDGVQGRYFIPLLGAIAIIMTPRKKKFNLSKQNLYFFIHILLLQYVLYSITYFY